VGGSPNRYDLGTHARVFIAGSGAARKERSERLFRQVAMTACWVLLGVMGGYGWAFFHFATN
jgi:hypothetical protein